MKLIRCFLAFLVISSQAIQAEEKTSTSYFFVGELGATWEFPSDHLPIGGTVGTVHFAMWNILYKGALHHIVGNGQGLRDSYIMEADFFAEEGDTLTVRESVIVENILEMIDHPTHPRSVVALQETGEEVFETLQSVLPAHKKLVPSTVEDLGHGDLFIYDSELFELIAQEKVHYKTKASNTIIALTLREKATGIVYHFVQSHVPGGPVFSAPARQELAELLMENFDSNVVTIVMGDMNRSPDYFLEDFAKASEKHGLETQPFVNLWIPYPTHINTHREASWIDNLFIANPYPELQISVTEDPVELFEDLKDTVELLESLRREGL